MEASLILLRWVHFAATATATGTVAFLLLIAEPAFRSGGGAAGWSDFARRARLLTGAALLLAVCSGAAWLVWVAADITNASLLDVCRNGDLWTVLTQTRFGLVSISRLALALLLGASMLRPAARLAQHLLQIAAATALIGALALTGHAGAEPGPAGAVHLAADMPHLIAAGCWLGALPALALLLDRARRARTDNWSRVAAHAAHRFSPLGIACVATLLASGSLNAWMLLSSPRDIIVTGYGRLLLVKIGLFVAMLGIAAVNRFRLTPRLPERRAMRALLRNTLGETGLGLCVLLLVGALGTLAPPRHDHAHRPPAMGNAPTSFVHIHSEQVMAEVSIAPGPVGPARATIRLMREDLSEFPAQAVTLLLTPQAASGIASISRSALHRSDGTWQVDRLDNVQPGVWTVVLDIATGGGTLRLDATIVIDR
jgi:putative copper resistance protein D